MLRIQSNIIIFTVILLFALIGCKDRVAQMSELVQQKKYVEAKRVYAEIEPETQSQPEVQALVLKIHEAEISDLITFKHYTDALNEIHKLQPNLQDSQEIKSLQAKTEASLKSMITGKWVGQSDQDKATKIFLCLQALTTTSFNGYAGIDNEYWYIHRRPAIGVGTFNERELATTVDFGRSGRFFGHIENPPLRAMAGTIENDVMKITLDDRPYITEKKPYSWTLRKVSDRW